MTAPADAKDKELDMTALPEGETGTALDQARAALDRLALDRLVFDIRTWWARNRQLHDQVLLQLAGRLDERRGHVAR